MSNYWVLWEDEGFIITTPKNPHISPEEGCHIKINPKISMEKSWDDPVLAGKTFEFAAKASKIIVQEKIADWVNIQNNGNWGLLPNRKLNFHIHIYGRKKSGKTWIKPVKLPELPNTFRNKPMSFEERERLKSRFCKDFG